MAQPINLDCHCGCRGCPKIFPYQMKNSPNFPKFCEPCRTHRNLASKVKYETRRKNGTPNERPKMKLGDFRDYDLNPMRIVEFAMRYA